MHERGRLLASPQEFFSFLSTHSIESLYIYSNVYLNLCYIFKVLDFALWLQEMKVMHGFQHVVVIAGNHDTTFHEVRIRHPQAAIRLTD